MSGPETWDPLWKQLELIDAISSGVAAHRFQYPTGLARLKPTEQIPKLDEIGEALATYLDTLPKTHPEDPIVLVGHSQGGLVIQTAIAHCLANSEAERLRCVTHCVLISTPTNGSDFLGRTRRFLAFIIPWWGPQERSLRPLNEYIGTLQRQIARDVVYASIATQRSLPIPITAVYGTEDAIVKRQSARWVFPRTKAVPGNHSTVIRPSKPDSPLCAIIEQVVSEARYSLPADGSLIRTAPIFPRNAKLLQDTLELHHTHFTASQSVRKEDVEYWIGRYEPEFGIRLRVLAALVDETPRGFLMFHEDSKRDIAVVDYLVSRGEDELDNLAVRKLVDRLRSILAQSGITQIVFEVARPMSGSDRRKRDAARIRLFEKKGARTIPRLSYVAPSMDGTFSKDSEEPGVLMVASIAQPPQSIPWSQVRDIVTYLYGTWYGNWFSHRHANDLDRMHAYLDDLKARVLAPLPSSGSVTLPERFVP